MKTTRSILFITFIIAFSNLYSQEISNNESQFIFKNSKPVDISLFLGPEVKFTHLINGFGAYAGVKAAILFNNSFALGLAGGGFVTETVFDGPTRDGVIDGLNTIMGYGGFYLDYIIPSKMPFQISFPTLIGAGGVVLFEKSTEALRDEKMVEGGVFLIIEPAVNLEMNVSKFFRPGIGVGYRLAFRGDMDRLAPKDVSGLSVNLNFKFGSF
ncbi:MAG: hypothetical protein JXJ22_02320 [Bacteroidales bacterium]|nr:hypothetical protein [Bacteroidales bacterium]